MPDLSDMVVGPASPVAEGAGGFVLLVPDVPETGLRLLRAWQETEHTVAADFASAVKASSEYDPDDATNLANWSVTLPDGAPVPDILEASSWKDPETGQADPVRILLRLAGPPARRGETATLTPSAAIVSADGTEHADGTGVTFDGVAPPARAFVAAVHEAGLRDLRNLQSGVAAGTLALDARGDYSIETAQETVKKLVLRALTTAAGEFAHLPRYGAATRLKGIGTRTEVERVAREARRAILDIPGVANAAVSVSLKATGVLTVRADVRTMVSGNVVVSWSPTEGAR